MNALNDAVRVGAPAGYPAPSAPAEDLTPHMMRIIRRALRTGSGGTPLERAIRSAVAVCEPAPGDDPHAADDPRTRQLAGRASATFAPRLARMAGGTERLRRTVWISV